jgi:hypothetical protein
LSSFSIDLKTSPDDVFSEVQQCVGTANYKVKNIIPSQSIIAEGKRDFSWIIVIVLAILLWPAAIVYYFTRQRSSVTVTISKNDEGCNITAISNGHSSEDLMKLIDGTFESEEKNSENRISEQEEMKEEQHELDLKENYEADEKYDESKD